MSDPMPPQEGPRFSPRELQVKTKAMWDKLPFKLHVRELGNREFHRNVIERLDSSDRVLYLSNFSDLLSQSPGTQASHKYLTYFLRDRSISGFDPKTPDHFEEVVEDTLDFSTPHGIYDEKGAFKADDILIQLLEEQMIDALLGDMKIGEEAEEVFEPDGDFNFLNRHHLKALFEEWKDEYRTKYKKEPPKLDYKLPYKPED